MISYIKQKLDNFLKEENIVGNYSIEIPTNFSNGNFSTNIAMKILKEHQISNLQIILQ